MRLEVSLGLPYCGFRERFGSIVWSRGEVWEHCFVQRRGLGIWKDRWFDSTD
jgi:hypothetical protein